MLNFQLIVVFGLIGEAVFAAGIALITLLVFHNTDGRSLFVGAICVAFSIILSASPLSIMVSSIYCFRSEHLFKFSWNFRDECLICNVVPAETSHQDKKRRIHAVLDLSGRLL